MLPHNAPNKPQPNAEDDELRNLVGGLFMLVAWGGAEHETSRTAKKFNFSNYGLKTISEIVTLFRPGGILLYQWAENLQSIDQIVSLTNEIQLLAKQSNNPPLLLAVDQEMGPVDRLPHEFTHFSGNRALAKYCDSQFAESVAYATGKELSSVGINSVFAPVLDLGRQGTFIKERAFSDDAKVVADFGKKQIAGFQRAAIASFVKHFPGHGLFKEDTHFQVACVENVDIAYAEQTDLLPFSEAAEAGVEGVMLAHFGFRALDPDGLPSTISAPLISYLRQKMGFQGVIVTDAMTMLRQAPSPEESLESCIQALTAGADLILAPCFPSYVMEQMIIAVKKGKISRARIEEAATRVSKLRSSFIRAPSTNKESSKIVGNSEHTALSKLLSEKCISWAKPPSQKLSKKFYFISDEPGIWKQIKNTFESICSPMTFRRTNLLRYLLCARWSRSTLIILSKPTSKLSKQLSMLQKFASKRQSVVFLHIGEISDPASVNSADAVMVLYSAHQSDLEVAASLLNSQ